jgi:NADH-quinone oxidoreductase subunit M
MPLVATLFVMAGLASLGLPGMSGFIAEFTVFIGSFGAIPIQTILGAFGVVITAGYTLWMLQRIFFGPPTARWADLGDARGVEIVPLVSLIAVIILVGVYPSILTTVVDQGIATLALRLGP